MRSSQGIPQTFENPQFLEYQPFPLKKKKTKRYNNNINNSNRNNNNNNNNNNNSNNNNEIIQTLSETHRKITQVFPSAKNCFSSNVTYSKTVKTF